MIRSRSIAMAGPSRFGCITCLLLVLVVADATASIAAAFNPSRSSSSNGAWLQLGAGGTAPSARTRHAAIYDPVRNRMVVFGGVDDNGAPYRNDTWVLTLSGSPAWSQLFPGGAPPSGRIDHTAIYDPVRDRMVVFGGFDTSTRNDVWALSLSGTPAWSQIFPGGMPPSARSAHAAIYDPVRDRMIVFGGALGVSPFFVNDVWALSFSGTPLWTQLFPAVMPPSARTAHSAIYDPTADRFVAFGGRDLSSDYLADLWALSLSGTPVWSQLFPAGVPPSARIEHTAIHDPMRHRMVVFGGEATHITYPNDVWALTLTGSPVWTQLLPSGIPPAGRFHHSAVYGTASDRMVVFDGDVDGPIQNDLWALDWGEPAGIDVGPLVQRFALAPPRPNPSRGPVTFDFDLPKAAQVLLEVYDVRGRRVKMVEDTWLTPGRYSRAWDGWDEAGAPAPDGVYFVRLGSPEMTVRRRGILIR